MSNEYRGGNSRLLSKLLDQTENPLAVLDRRGHIVFANVALCRLVDADSTQLVGKACSWQVPKDGEPFASILVALAPPARALRGKVVTRRLSAPIVFGSQATGQIFQPLMDQDHVLQLVVVMLGEWELLRQQLDEPPALSGPLRRSADETLVAIRSRWKSLDKLTPLFGNSPAIQLALERVQLAIQSAASVMIIGPAGVGKREVAEGLFLGRLQQLGMPPVTGQMLPVDCRTLDTDLLQGMLGAMRSRLRSESACGSQQLLLLGIDRLDTEAIHCLIPWLQQQKGVCSVVCTSETEVEQLSSRGADWPVLLALVAAIAVDIPGLQLRIDDIRTLALHLLAEKCVTEDRAQLTFSQEALDLLSVFPWPNNLTQLRKAVHHAVEQAVLTAVVRPEHLPVELRTYPGSIAGGDSQVAQPIELDSVLLEVERRLIERALALSPRNRAQAARMLGISRPRLLRRIQQLGIE